MKLIETHNLKKVFSNEEVETVALSDVSLSIEKGEFVAIMGPSGSGKSTLLHILGLLDSPTSGTYHFNGENVEDLSMGDQAKFRNRTFGFVFQSFNLLPRTSVLENVELPLLYSGVPKEQWDQRAREVIEKVGLTHRLKHEPSQLSGGEKQRAAIARALVMKPDVIFADEPTGNLDTKSGQMVMATLEELNINGGHTVILITHEHSTAEHAERIIYVQDGEVVSDKKVQNRRSAREAYIK